MFIRFGDPGALQSVVNFNQEVMATLAYVLMAIGGVLTIVGFMGCCGAYQESTCLLGTVSTKYFKGAGRALPIRALVGALSERVEARIRFDSLRFRMR